MDGRPRTPSDAGASRRSALRRRVGSFEALAHQEGPVAAGMIGDRRDDLEADARVERRRLEGESHQQHLRAAAATRLLLRSAEQARAEAPAALRLLDPELADLAAAAPGIAADAGDDASGVVAQEEREQLAVRDAGDARVVFVDAIFEVLHV